jgi:hypothetical protein
MCTGSSRVSGGGRKYPRRLAEFEQDPGRPQVPGLPDHVGKSPGSSLTSPVSRSYRGAVVETRLISVPRPTGIVVLRLIR